MILKKYALQLKELMEEKDLLTCPKCNRQDLEYTTWEWHCLWNDCLFHTTEIPTKQYIQSLLHLEQQRIDLKKLQGIRKMPYKRNKKFDAFRKLIKIKRSI